MLNKNLQDEIQVHMIGKIIREQRIFVVIFDERV